MLVFSYEDTFVFAVDGDESDDSYGDLVSDGEEEEDLEVEDKSNKSEAKKKDKVTKEDSKTEKKTKKVSLILLF